MKGIALQWNVTVYLIITLIVIGAIVAFVYWYYPKDEDYFYLMRLGCIELIKNCGKDLDQILVEGKKGTYDLEELCEFNQISDPNDCKKACGC